MNLPLLLILFLLFGGERTADVRNLLARIDFASFAPVLKLLGLGESAIDFLSSENFEKLIEGGDLKSVLPAILSSFGKKEKPSEGSSDGNAPVKNNYLEPIKDVAATDVEEALGSYFS